jgi:ATP-dependent protease ClpP protease subunit
LYINSTGGSVFEGSAIYSQLKRHNAKVTVYIDGFACSIASVIAMAGDKVIMSENAVMMIHNAWAVAAGNSAQLRKIADDLDVINKANKAAYLVKSDGKITDEELTEMLDNETYLSAEDCVKYGFCDEISSKVDNSVENHVEMLAYKNSIEKIYAMAEKPEKQDKSETFKKMFNI